MFAPLFCCALLSVISSFAIISFGKRGQVELLCHLTISGLCLFLVVPWVGLQCVILEFPGHTHVFM